MPLSTIAISTVRTTLCVCEKCLIIKGGYYFVDRIGVDEYTDEILMAIAEGVGYFEIFELRIYLKL